MDVDDIELEDITMERLNAFSKEELEQLSKRLESDTSTESSDSGFPKGPSKDTIFKFFHELINSKDSRKIGNVKPGEELGMPKMSVRKELFLARYAHAEGLDMVEEYFKDRAEITLSTSMSKNGFLAQLFVTQIKQEKKSLKDSEKKKRMGWLFPKAAPGMEE